jgi:hypothetical protein
LDLVGLALHCPAEEERELLEMLIIGDESRRVTAEGAD